jgi:HEAT repeat protein
MLTSSFSFKPDVTKIFEKISVEEMYKKRDVDGLIKVLKNKDGDIRQEAVRFLGMIGDSRAVEPLIQALKDGDGIVQSSVAVALEKIGGQAVEPLIRVLKVKNKNVQVWTEVILGSIKDPRAVEPLLQALKDEDQTVRAGAVDALCKIEEPAVEPLIQSLKKENNIVARLGIVTVLGGIGDMRAVEPLNQAMMDEDARVRLGALIGLEKIKRRKAEETGNSI